MLLTLNEVCERLRMSRKSVIKLINSGELEASRVGTAGRDSGGVYRITEEALAAYLESCKVEPAEAAS
jgi:excisionase family DNA binding protein